MLINRMTTAKSLPAFNGDPLDWIRFKQAFDLSSNLGEYSDRENVTRLYEALKDRARDAMKALFAAGTSANEIMHALELRFGNSKLILEKLVNDIKNLPNMETKKINLLEFASILKNSVSAIRSLSLLG